MKYTIKNFNKDFPNDDACLSYIVEQQGGTERTCEKCQGPSTFYKVKNRKAYACGNCGHHIHPLAGTIFHKSSTSLKDWFYAMFLFSTSKNGVAAKELERALGVTYKCAWRMAKQIRLLMKDPTSFQLSGTVELDETYVGGKGGNNKRGRGAENKTPVFGMVERGGSVRARVVVNVKAKTLLSHIEEHVAIGTDIMTDEFKSYVKLNTLNEYKHRKVVHSAKQYVVDDVHTNSIEGFWSQLKRSLHGTYHVVSPKYLPSYVDEFSWRYNFRKEKSIFPILVGSSWMPVE